MFFRILTALGCSVPITEKTLQRSIGIQNHVDIDPIGQGVWSAPLYLNNVMRNVQCLVLVGPKIGFLLCKKNLGLNRHLSIRYHCALYFQHDACTLACMCVSMCCGSRH